MTLNMKIWCSRFFQIGDLDTRANLCEKWFLSNIHQKWKWSRRNEKKMCDANGTNNSIIFFKDNVRA